jgi:DNA ligase (NAD+)
MDALEGATVEELTRAREVGERVAEAIRQFFDRPENRRLVTRLREAGLTLKPAPRVEAPAAGPFAGKAVVITGTLPGFTRDEVRRLVREAGGRVTEGMSRRTDILIAGEDPGSKVDKARALGVRIMDAAEFAAISGAAGAAGREER